MKNDYLKLAIGAFGIVNLLRSFYYDWTQNYAMSDHYTLAALMCFFLTSSAWIRD